MELMGCGMASGLADQCHTWGWAMLVCHQVTVAGSAPMRVLHLVCGTLALVAPSRVWHSTLMAPKSDGTKI